VNLSVAADGVPPPLNRSVGRLLSEDRYEWLGSFRVNDVSALTGGSSIYSGP